jgi:hypothetical protein
MTKDGHRAIKLVKPNNWELVQRHNWALVHGSENMPSNYALRERSDIPARNIEFLSRHDRESGDLYGILPLIKGMPVAMTDHIDRSIDKRILRGRVGHVHSSWILDVKETSQFQNWKRILSKLPKVIFVIFLIKKKRQRTRLDVRRNV